MKKEDIKKIKFKNSLDIEFEIIDISTVYKRYENGDLDFDIHKFHRPQFNMILLLENSCKHFIDFKTYELNRGDILFLGSNRVHAFSKESRLSGTAVIFTDSFVETNNISLKYFKKLYNTVLIKDRKDTTVENLFQILKDEYSPNTDKVILYKYLLGALFSKLSLLIQNDESKELNNNAKLVLKLNLLIEKFNYQCRDSQTYAKELGYSYKQLNLIIKYETDYTLKQYIDRFIILEMKRQIVANDMNLKELCIFFDFDEESNLLKYFKRLTGLSPKKFKDRYKNFRG